MKIKREFLIVMIFLAMIISGLMSCKKKELTPLIQNYKLYRNAFLSFQYPSDWIIDENGTNVTVSGPQQDAYFVNFKVDYNDQIDMSLDEFAKTVEDQNQVSSLPAYVDKGRISLDLPVGKAVQRSFTTNVNTQFSDQPVNLMVTLLFITQNNKIGYVITTEVPSRVYQNYSEIFENLKKSFRFQSIGKS